MYLVSPRVFLSLAAGSIGQQQGIYESSTAVAATVDLSFRWLMLHIFLSVSDFTRHTERTVLELLRFWALLKQRNGDMRDGSRGNDITQERGGVQDLHVDGISTLHDMTALFEELSSSPPCSYACKSFTERDFQQLTKVYCTNYAFYCTVVHLHLSEREKTVLLRIRISRIVFGSAISTDDSVRYTVVFTVAFKSSRTRNRNLDKYYSKISVFPRF